jgi:hypothetical protein
MASVTQKVMKHFAKDGDTFYLADALMAAAMAFKDAHADVCMAFLMRQLQYLQAYHFISKEKLQSVAGAGNGLLSSVCARLLQPASNSQNAGHSGSDKNCVGSVLKTCVGGLPPCCAAASRCGLFLCKISLTRGSGALRMGGT